MDRGKLRQAGHHGEGVLGGQPFKRDAGGGDVRAYFFEAHDAAGRKRRGRF